jgi:3-methyladenine DNA glycosylase AlkD
MNDVQTILKELKALGSEKNRSGMARFGIETKRAYGISIPTLRQFAKKIGTNHRLALKLWDSGFHEARLLASFIDAPNEVTQRQMERWAKDFDSWDVCDQCCSVLFDKTKYADKKAIQWSRRQEEFVKRAGFVLMAALSVHDKKADHSVFEKFLPLIEEQSSDERNFVKKAVNWSLRQIGKRNRHLNKKAIVTANTISRIESHAAKWIASDALRELRNKKIQARLP